MFLKRVRIASFIAILAILGSGGAAFAQPITDPVDHQNNMISTALNCPDGDMLANIDIPSRRVDYNRLSQFADCTVVAPASIVIPNTGTRTNPMTGFGLQERLAAAADQRNAASAGTESQSKQAVSLPGWGMDELQAAVEGRNKILGDPYADPEFLRFKMRQMEQK